MFVYPFDEFLEFLLALSLWCCTLPALTPLWRCGGNVSSKVLGVAADTVVDLKKKDIRFM